MLRLIRMVFVWSIAAVWVLACVLPLDLVAAEADRRVALIIGNGAYKHAPALANPVDDAKAVAATFERLHFEVIEGYDLTYDEMGAKVRQFTLAIPGSTAALVYYAGHGVSADEAAYLVPTDLALKDPSDLELRAIGLSSVLELMNPGERVNIVLFDAALENPLAAPLARGKTRSLNVGNGPARGTLLAFAADPKSLPLDGKPGEHSPFTKALLKHLEDRGVTIYEVMDRVRADVWTETNHKQIPWINSSLIGAFYLNP